MKLTANKTFVFIVILVVIVFSNVTGAASLDDTQVTFSSTEIENHFPTSLKFSVNVSSESTLQSAKFFYYFRNEKSTTMVALEIQASKQMDLTYTLDTSDLGAVPSTPIFYYWQVKLDSGETVKSQEALVYYDDIRYDWQVHEQGNMAVWWHDRPKAFGDLVLSIADETMKKQRNLFGIELEFPIRLIIYNTDEEFAEWHTASTALIGGQAFPSMGITTQIVEDDIWQEEWLMEVVPHEISHLYFFQVTYHPLAMAPSWLDEGVAQLNQFGDNAAALDAAKDAVRSGNYLPLWGLTGSFDDSDEDKFNLAYNESLSAVTYLVEIYGEDILSQLFAEYKKGNPTDKAFQNILGISFGEFEMGWLEWLGAPADTYIPPRSFTTRSLPGYPMQTPQATLVASATRVSTPLLIPSVTPSSYSEFDTSRMYLFGITVVCLAGLCLSIVLLAVVLGVVISKGKKH